MTVVVVGERAFNRKLNKKIHQHMNGEISIVREMKTNTIYSVYTDISPNFFHCFTWLCFLLSVFFVASSLFIIITLFFAVGVCGAFLLIWITLTRLCIRFSFFSIVFSLVIFYCRHLLSLHTLSKNVFFRRCNAKDLIYMCGCCIVIM